MEDPLQIRTGVAIPLAEIELRVSRSSGPGGQHANVTESRVEAVFDVAASSVLTENQRRRLMSKIGPRLTASAQDTRSQTRNRELALERLRARLRDGLAVRRRRRPTRRTRASEARRLDAKRRRSQAKRERRRPSSEGW